MHEFLDSQVNRKKYFSNKIMKNKATYREMLIHEMTKNHSESKKKTK
jgi:hypothetical protein